MPYPYQFNPYQPYQGYQPQVQQQVYQAGIVWVGSFEEASAYPIAPNTVLPMWDRNAQTIYWKQSDAAGRQSIRILDYKDRNGAQEGQQATPELATKQDIAGLAAAIQALQESLKGGADNA